mmetsp:Transcript_1673/g.1766  ORF Transcript_1673/g.1766 Transcript_1673/m.1766 type:complete len:1294 (-) Transcript_1673:7-3888(-)
MFPQGSRGANSNPGKPPGFAAQPPGLPPPPSLPPMSSGTSSTGGNVLLTTLTATKPTPSRSAFPIATEESQPNNAPALPTHGTKLPHPSASDYTITYTPSVVRTHKTNLFRTKQKRQSADEPFSYSEPQPNTTPIANFLHAVTEHPQAYPHGKLIDTSDKLIVYAAKNGLIRVIDKSSAGRTLLRGHAGFVSDVRFYQRNSSILATIGGLPAGAGSTGNTTTGVLIWKIEDSSSAGGEIVAQKLLEIRASQADDSSSEIQMRKLKWHASNTNLFLVLMENEVGLIDSTQLQTSPSTAAEGGQHSVCELSSNNDTGGGFQQTIRHANNAELFDMDWFATNNNETMCVLTYAMDGVVNLWLLSNRAVTCVKSITTSNSPISSGQCLLLPPPFLPLQHQLTPSFVTCHVEEKEAILQFYGKDAMQATKITSAATNATKLVVQEMGEKCALESCFRENSNDVFLTLADKTSGKLFVLAVKNTTDMPFVDCVAPYRVLHPILSWSVQLARKDGSNSDKDEISMYCVQTKAVQLLRMDVDQCVSSQKGRVAQRDQGVVLTLPEEDYELEDDEQEEEASSSKKEAQNDSSKFLNTLQQERSAANNIPPPPAASLPPPGLGALNNSSTPMPAANEGTNTLSLLGGNSNTAAFSNWLGAIVGPPPPASPSNESAAEDVAEAALVESLKSATLTDLLQPTPQPTKQPSSSSTPSRVPVPLPTTEGKMILTRGMNNSSNSINSTSTSSTFLSPMDILKGLPPASNTNVTAKPNVVTSTAATAKPGPTPVSNAKEVKKSRVKTPPRHLLASTNTPSKKKHANNASNNSKQQALQVAKTEKKIPNHQSSSNINNTPVVKILKREPKTSTSKDALRDTTSREQGANLEAMLQKALAHHTHQTETQIRLVLTQSLNNAMPAIHKSIRDSQGDSKAANLSKMVKEVFMQHAQEEHKAWVEREEQAEIQRKEREVALKVELMQIVKESVREPVIKAFHQTMREVVIPTYESAAREMFHQISTKLNEGLSQQQQTATLMAQTEANATRQQLHAMSTAFETSSRAVQTLTEEVSALRSFVENQASLASASRNHQNGGGHGLNGAPVGAHIIGGAVIQQQQLSVNTPPPQQPPQPPQQQVMMDQNQMLRSTIAQLIDAQDYEQAFTKALSASSAEICLFTCRRADLLSVLQTLDFQLSQPILLCLMQQIGSVLQQQHNNSGIPNQYHQTVSDVKMELEWLQEIALTIDPKDERIQNHVGEVVLQLANTIHARLNGGEGRAGEAALRRPLQMLLQVIRGIGVLQQPQQQSHQLS